MNLPKQVTVVDVGPRDGFQMEPGFIPTEHKIKIIDQLSEAGIKRIEVTSFVHPKYVPQLADAEEVITGIKKKEGVVEKSILYCIFRLVMAIARPAIAISVGRNK